MADVLFTNARIFDGSGDLPFVLDSVVDLPLAPDSHAHLPPVLDRPADLPLAPDPYVHLPLVLHRPIDLPRTLENRR